MKMTSPISALESDGDEAGPIVFCATPTAELETFAASAAFANIWTSAWSLRAVQTHRVPL